MTSATPKPRAGEHTRGPKFVEVPTADWRAVLAERDLLRERARELHSSLKWLVDASSNFAGSDPDMPSHRDSEAEFDAALAAATETLTANGR